MAHINHKDFIVTFDKVIKVIKVLKTLKVKQKHMTKKSWLIYLEHILMIPLATYWLQIVKSNNIQYKQYIKCVCISEQVGLQSKLNFAQY